MKSIGGIADAIANAKKVTEPKGSSAEAANGSTAKEQPQKSQPKAKGKGNGKKSDTSEDSDDEPGRVKPRNRPTSARQAMLKNDRNHFVKIKRAKDRNERKADTSAAAVQADDNDDHDEGVDDGAPKSKAADKQPKKAAPKTKAAAKKATAADATTDDDSADGSAHGDCPEDETGKKQTKKATPKKATASKKAAPDTVTADNAALPTLVKGNLIRAVTAEPKQKPKRSHHPPKFEDDEAPDDSDFENARSKNGYARLWDSIDRHARWCPFVRLNKKHEHAHRRLKALEAALYNDSDDDGDNDDDGPKPKAKKPKPAQKAKKAKPAPKKSKKNKPEVDEDQDSEHAQSIVEIQNKAVDDVLIPADAASESSSDNERTEFGSEDSVEDISGEDESEGVPDTKRATPKASSAKKDSSNNKTRSKTSGADIGTSDSSDQDLSLLSPGKLAELQGAFNKDMAMKSSAGTTDEASAEAPKASTAKSGAGRKRKAADVETTTQEPAKKAKKQRKSKDDSVLILEEVLPI